MHLPQRTTDSSKYGSTLRLAASLILYSLIAVPGLGGHAFGSFRDPKSKDMWLRDALPFHIIGDNDKTQTTRVITYGYESNLNRGDDLQSLSDFGNAFITSVLDATVGNTRPIIFVAHSLGGLIVKEVRTELLEIRVNEPSSVLTEKRPS